MKQGCGFALMLAVACGAETGPPRGEMAAGAGGAAGSGVPRGGGAGESSGGSGGELSGGRAGATAAGSAGELSGGSGGALGGSASATVAGGAGALTGGRAGTGGLGGSPAGGAGGTTAGGSGGSASADSGGFTIDARLASDIAESAPTTVGIVTWSLGRPGLTQAHVDFGLDTTYGRTAPVDLTHADYRTVLVGLKPEKTYHFRIVATDGSATYTSDDHSLTTGAPTSAVPITSFSIESPSRVDEGFFIGSFWSVGSGDPWTAFILDTQGDIVWWYTEPEPGLTGEQGFGRARLSADSQDMWLVRASNGGGPLRRVSIDTLDAQKYPDTVGSHDIAAVGGDRMAYLDYGEADCDSIFEIDKAGTITEVFESTGVTGTTEDFCHGNAVRYSQKEDAYVFSDKQLDVVLVGRDGDVRWKLSEMVSGGVASYGGHQHGAQLLDESLLIFANAAGGFNVAQALEFDLEGNLIESFMSRGGGDFFGDVQRLPSGNTLIVYSTHGFMQVVDPSDTVVLEIRSSVPFGYVEFRQSLYGPPLDIQQ